MYIYLYIIFKSERTQHDFRRLGQKHHNIKLHGPYKLSQVTGKKHYIQTTMMMMKECNGNAIGL